jgi:hypothetical protein
MPEVRKGGESPECLFLKKLQPDAGPDAVQDGPARPVSSSRGQRRNTPRVCDRTLFWPDQIIRSVHLGTEERCTQNARPTHPKVPGTGASG